MRYAISQKALRYLLVILAVVSAAFATRLFAQGAGGAPARDARTPESVAPIDLTGYWVSVVTEDWRYRMIVPDKGDYQSVPLNPQGIKLADSWDPDKDQASGNQCKSYGAPAIMRVPGRLHIFWENDTTLRIDTDSGTQTRLFHFGGTPPQGGAPQWQGYSVADWEGMRPEAAPAAPGAGPAGQAFTHEGYLKVVTGNLRPGYLRKNGIPYGGNTALEEYYDSFKEMNGDIWLVVTTIVTDPEYLRAPFVASTHFKKLSGATGWDATPCRSNEPR